MQSSGSHYVSIDTDQLRNCQRFGPWTTTDCHSCGFEYELTRTQDKLVKRGEVLLCSTCSAVDKVEKLNDKVISDLKEKEKELELKIENLESTIIGLTGIIAKLKGES